MKTAYIGIGSNLGDAQGNCLKAVEKIERIPGCNLVGFSPWYTTEPVGVQNQDWYVNGVAVLSVDIPAQVLMKRLLDIEADMGRVRNKRWESRIIDLDILIFGEDIINEDNLIVPHPLMHGRRFVLAPMTDLAPDLKHPSLGWTMNELLSKVSRNNQVVRLLKD